MMVTQRRRSEVRRADREARLALAVDNDPRTLDVLRKTLGEDDDRLVTADLANELAGVYEFMGDRQRQRHALEMAVKSDPTRPAVLMAAANSYLSGGDEQSGQFSLAANPYGYRELPRRSL